MNIRKYIIYYFYNYYFEVMRGYLFVLIILLFFLYIRYASLLSVEVGLVTGIGAHIYSPVLTINYTDSKTSNWVGDKKNQSHHM